MASSSLPINALDITAASALVTLPLGLKTVTPFSFIPLIIPILAAVATYALYFWGTLSKSANLSVLISFASMPAACISIASISARVTVPSGSKYSFFPTVTLCINPSAHTAIAAYSFLLSVISASTVFVLFFKVLTVTFSTSLKFPYLSHTT